VVCSRRYTPALTFEHPQTAIYATTGQRYGQSHAEPCVRLHLGQQAAFRGGSRRAHGHLIWSRPSPPRRPRCGA